MKTLLLSSAFALAIAPAAYADRYAVIDFNGDGIVDESDYIGSKASIAAAAATAPVAAPAQYEWKETTRTVVVPGSTNVVDVSTLAPAPGTNYVNIGMYQGGEIGTLEVAPATTRTVVDRQRVLVKPAVTAYDTGAEVVPNPHGYYDAAVPSTLIDNRIYVPKPGADGVITAAEMGYTEEDFNSNRLAAYDTNGDGTVTMNEAVSNLDPLLDPNVEAVRDAYYGVNEIVTPESKDL